MDTRLVELFLEVAAIEGLSGSERAVADHILAFLRELGLEPFEDGANSGNGGDSGNVVCRIGGGGDRALLAHMDTVRSTAGLKPRILEDRITSDGTTALGVDNRVGVAVLLYTVEKMVNGEHGSFPFTVVFTVCEETTLVGSRFLDPGPEIRMAFVLDSALRPGNFIARSHGARRFRANIRGRAAHSGIDPDSGINALLVASEAMRRFPLGKVDQFTTVNVGRFSGGSAINVVPEMADMEGEVRSVDTAKVDLVIGRIEGTLQQVADSHGAEVLFESEWDFRPYSLDPQSEVYLRVERALEKVGLEPVPATSPGGSDANMLNARGVPTVNLGIGAQNPHTNDEFILLEDLRHCALISIELIKG